MPQPPQSQALTTRFFPAADPSGRLVVVLHGLGDSMEGFFWMPELMELPGVNYLLANAPNPYYVGFAWYDIENPLPGVLAGRALLATLFAELERQGWQSDQIVLFGFSQGCLMAVDFALRHQQPLAGIVGVSGHAMLEDDTEAQIDPQAKKQRWLITHGHDDPVLPLERTRGQMERLRAAGIPIEWHEFPKEHTIDFEEELPLLRRWMAACWEG